MRWIHCCANNFLSFNSFAVTIKVVFLAKILKNTSIGVLAIQGSVIEHVSALKRVGEENVVEVRTISDLNRTGSLVIPGGESTTIGKLLKLEGLDKEIIRRAHGGMPIYGTCAGVILVAKRISEKAARLNLIDIKVKRNAYGRQVDSFETKILAPKISKKPIKAIFIRAPKILSAGKDVEILAKYKGDIIMCRQGNILVSTFHPELTDDTSVHKYFLKMSR